MMRILGIADRSARSRLRGGVGERDPEGEAAAVPRPALHRDAPAVRFGDMAHERQPHSAASPALGLAPSHPVELLEDAFLLSRWDADALVGDRECQMGGVDAGVYRQRAALAG